MVPSTGQEGVTPVQKAGAGGGTVIAVCVGLYLESGRGGTTKVFDKAWKGAKDKTFSCLKLGEVK